VSRSLVSLVLALLTLVPAVASATPVATSDSQYQLYGRVFPDPLAGCQQMGASPCSPNAQGNLPANQFIGWQEQVDGLAYMNSKPAWQRYMEVWPLDGKLGAGTGTDERASFPGNDLGRFEFTPSEAFQSAGLATNTAGRNRLDLLMVRVTDETVPDEGKKRYLVSMGMHGIERAGVEGGTRAIEDLVTAGTLNTAGKPILPKGAVANTPTFGDVLRKAIVYFIYPNPDGWLRGSVSQGGVFFQRYNGNGMDVNRDWPDVGFMFRPYSPLSEPESRAYSSALSDIRARSGAFGAAVDLHGMPATDALSYTLIGHGRHDFAKNERLQAASMAIHRATQAMLTWSPLIQDDKEPKGGGLPCGPGLVNDTCAKVYGQTWGTVYDTINYTTTGAMGDWLDSPKGLAADGLNNEMAYSHLDKNVVFEPQTEQLHVEGNKALIYAQVASMLDPPSKSFEAAGRKGFVANTRLAATEQVNQGDAPAGTRPQDPIVGQSPDPAQSGPGGLIFPIDVKGGGGIFNGGMRVDVRTTNFQGLATGTVGLQVQCQGCDLQPGEPDGEGWITVQQDYNQSPAYAQAGVTAAVNRPQAVNRAGKKVLWRAVVDPQAGPTARMWVEFSSGPAALSGSTGGDAPPVQSAYDVANTDFFGDLNRSVADPAQRFRVVDPAAVVTGAQALDSFDTIVLADTVTPPGFTAAERGAWLGALRDWVSAGGNLVLTDSALSALPDFTSVPAEAVKARKLYLGQIAYQDPAGKDTLGDPLNKGVALEGARFGSGQRRQTYEPVPLGYAIQTPDDGTAYESPQWDVDATAFTKAGGRIAATSATQSDAADTTRATVGEFTVGQGRVRVLGSGLPQPTEKFDHTLGLEPYALTYTGYAMIRNLVDWPQRGSLPAAAVPATGPGSAPTSGSQLSRVACIASNGFFSASARPQGRRVALSFRRRLARPVTVDVFQSSVGRRVIGARLVARFRSRARGLVWNGRATVPGRRVRDGVLFVRFRIRTASGRLDTRRPVLVRRGGRFRAGPDFYGRASCGTLPSAKLSFPVFGGRSRAPLGLAYRLNRAALVSVTVLRGRRVVRRISARPRLPYRAYRMRVPSARLRPGLYTFRIEARAGQRLVRRTLRARRL